MMTIKTNQEYALSVWKLLSLHKASVGSFSKDIVFEIEGVAMLN
jgi:hypothetical protein